MAEQTDLVKTASSAPTVGQIKQSQDGTKVARWNGSAWDIYDKAAMEAQLRQGAQTNAQNFEVARQQAGEVAATPEYQQMTREAGAEGRGMMLDTAINMAPSVAASLATGGVGGAIPMLGRGALGMLTRAAGQGGAELVRQKIQGEETNLDDAGLAAAISGGVDTALGTIGSLTKGLARKSPGVQARLSQRELGSARKYVKTNNLVENADGVKAAYDDVANLVAQHGDAYVPMSNSNEHLPNLISVMKKRKWSDKQPEIIGELEKVVKANTPAGPKANAGVYQPLPNAAPTLPFTEVDKVMKNLNSALNATTDANERRLIHQAKAALWKDLEGANIPTAQQAAYKTAVRTAREAFAKRDLNEAIEAGVMRSNVTGAQVINPKRILDKFDDLKSDPMFAGSFKPGELEKVEKFFVKMTQELRGHSAEGTAIVLGSGGGLIGSAAGGMVGMPQAGAAVGAASGVSMPGLFTKIALNDKGAAILLRMFATGRPVALPLISALSSAGASDLLHGK